MFKVKDLKDSLSKKIETPFFGAQSLVYDENNAENFCVLNQKFANESVKVMKNFQVFEDDVWVVTFIKCGTTWTQEMAWLINNDLNYEAAKAQTLFVRFPFIE